MRALLLALALFCAWPQDAGEYVLVKKGSNEYHRPGCEGVRDTSNVVAMTRGDAESRGMKPHAACDPSKAQGDKSAAKTPDVFVAPGDKRYHRESCAKLGKPRQRLALDEAGRKYWPCPVCKPPIRKRGA